ncbi:LuxR C-terminal-related transcriptional regulator [Kovacikia minuta CCNUW1]|uniref:helix-turn-helix transcriptional regulator n=1 Tax=Kovacikia minuta TaxID=2931930 RepID=UPI001CCB52DC|nr:LuxR family transcriptional regulator [Kovacikia minuta]UBF24305.1 LuxR C-terminal-related transcriptional regulator [Kovacikia minuta CCNUW1]
MLTQSERPKLLTHTRSFLLQGVLESLLDGILILTHQGEQIYTNDAARRICQQINQGKPIPPVPKEIWQACEALIESRSLYPDRPVIIESEITLSRTEVFRMRVRWLSLEDTQHPYLVVLLEDYCQSLQSRAISEVQQYSLTPRQAEVWLLHRMGYSYQEIADELYISHNTVKKHIKDIYAKQQRSQEILVGGRC